MNFYAQRTGKLYDASGVCRGVGYAGGNCGLNRQGINNPDMEGVKKIGPLPGGVYTRGTVVEGSHLGSFAIPLIPDPSNDMLGRSDFYMHGDKVNEPLCASEGCIIMPPNTRHWFYDCDDNQITVVPDYPTNSGD